MTKGQYTHKPHTEEQKRKISKALKGKAKSEEHKRKLSESKLGKKMSDERREQMSNTFFKDGITTDGYKRLNYKFDRELEHRKLIEDKIGRKLMPNEIIHHKNEDRLDNRIENLEIMTKSEHNRFHAIKNKLGKTGHQSTPEFKEQQRKRKLGKRMKEWIKKICPICKIEFEVMPYQKTQKFCSNKCFLINLHGAKNDTDKKTNTDSIRKSEGI